MKKLKRFNQYINGKMSQSELDQFTKKIVKDHFEDENRKEKYKKILEADYAINELKNNENSSVKKPHRLRQFLSIAASVLFLVIGIYTYQYFSKPAYENLLSQELDTPFLYTEARKDIISISEKRAEAVDFYMNKEYEKAAQVYEVIVSEEQSKEEDVFYLGLSYLYQRKAQKAVLQFNQILEKNNAKFEMEAKWFLALAYLEGKDFEKSSIFLNEIKQQKWKAKDAGMLLESLKSY